MPFFAFFVGRQTAYRQRRHDPEQAKDSKVIPNVVKKTCRQRSQKPQSAAKAAQAAPTFCG